MISLDNGDKIRGDASVATVVDYILSGTDANAIKQLAAAQLPNTIGDLYTADSVDAVTSIILVNTDSVARTVNLYITPSGGSDYRIIPKDMSLGIGHSLYTDGRNITVLDASGQVLSTWAVDDTPVDGETDKPISSNWAYDHKADIDAHISGATSRQLLVATGAATAVWKNTDITLTSPTINGTIATTALTMPAFTLGGTLNVNSQTLSNVAGINSPTTAGFTFTSQREDHDAAMVFNTPGVSPGFALTERLRIYGRAAETQVRWLACYHIGLKLGGALTLNGQDFDAGSGQAQFVNTGSTIMRMISTSAGSAGARVDVRHDSSSPAIDDAIFQIDAYGRDSGGVWTRYGFVNFLIEGKTHPNEAGKYALTLLTANLVDNLAMTISSAGEVAGDLAYAEFDKWDDKAVVQQLNIPVALREQYISEKLTEMGIATKAKGHIASGGYMLNLQKGFWFNFHALKQAYSEIDDLRERLVKIGG